MFNLPFPTDSLYKFAFIFGLVMVIYSVYFQDKQLNKFDEKGTYHIIDSLKKDTSNANFMLKHDSLEIYSGDVVEYSKDTVQMRRRAKSWLHIKQSYSTNVVITKAFDYVLEDSLKNAVIDTEYTDFNFKYRSLQKAILMVNEDFLEESLGKLKFYQGKIWWYTLYFGLLIVVGFSLFISGLVLWYFKIQIPQDALLKMQIEQIKNQNEKANAEFLSWKKEHETPPEVIPE